MRSIVLLALSLAAVAAVPKNSQRIVGGSVTTIDQYPQMASLLFSWLGINFSQTCGATILNVRAVITAAHCIFGDPPGRWRARVGSTWANSGGVVHNVATIIINPNYNTHTLDSDIAILHTATLITHNNQARPAGIAGANYNLGDNQVVWAAGWGTTSQGGSPSEQLRHVQIWTVNRAICRQRYATIGDTITDNMLCSGWLDVGGRDQCQGDSGGPLFHNRVLVGVCSWGRGCAQAFFPGVNVFVPRFTSWIVANG